MRLRTATALLSTLLLAGGAVAHPCASVPAADARLACYDAAFGAPPAGRGDDAQAAFGFSEHERRQHDPSQPPPLAQIEAEVARIDVLPGGERAIVLESGQVWAGAGGRLDGRIAIGDRIVIRRAALGSHLLVTRAGVGVRVRRLR